jgi:hypothetical protein
VMEGEYEVMNPVGSQIITRSEFASTVKPGTILEMNIILRKDSGIRANRVKCPRLQCGYNNFNVPANNGWIEWKVPLCFATQIFIELLHFSRKCSARFRVAEANDTDDIGQRSSHGLRKSENPHGEKLVGRSSSSVEEIISPASYVASRDDDESQFFCRMLVIYQGDGIAESHQQPAGQNILSPRTLEGSDFHSSASQHVPINIYHNRHRTSTQVFRSTSDLAAHYGIPTFLPPASKNMLSQEPGVADPVMGDGIAESHQQPPSQPEFADICSNYLNMLAQKPGDNNMTEDPVMVSAHDSTAPVFPPAVTQEAAVRALMDSFKGDSHCRCTALRR